MMYNKTFPWLKFINYNKKGRMKRNAFHVLFEFLYKFTHFLTYQNSLTSLQRTSN